LVIRFPARFGSLPARWDDVVEVRSIVPTVCDALSIESCADRSRSLLEQLRRGAPESPGVARSRTIDRSGRPLAAVITGNYKVILGNRIGAIELYDLERDPGERINLAPQSRSLVLRLRRLARAADDETMATTRASISEG